MGGPRSAWKRTSGAARWKAMGTSGRTSSRAACAATRVSSPTPRRPAASSPYKTGAVYTGSHCPPLEFTFPKSKKDPVVKYFGGEKKIVWESKGLKGSDSGGLLGGLFGK